MSNHDFSAATGNGEGDPTSSGVQGNVKITAKYAVTVSNELFHNGNVEAWVNIVESYKAKYPGLDVHIFFGGKAVENIQGLFKWGMVKHSDAILFSVSGADIQGVAASRGDRSGGHRGRGKEGRGFHLHPDCRPA